MAPSAVPIPSLHVLSRAPLQASGRWRVYEIGSPTRRTRASDVINHYINVSNADLIEREVARDLAASILLRFQHRRLLATAGT
jgi:hypothetical protein